MISISSLRNTRVAQKNDILINTYSINIMTFRCISSGIDGNRCINNTHNSRTRYCYKHLVMCRKSRIRYKKATQRMETLYASIQNIHPEKLSRDDTVRYIRLYMKMIYMLDDCYEKRRIHTERYVHQSCTDHGHLAQFYFIQKLHNDCINVLIMLYKHMGLHAPV